MPKAVFSSQSRKQQLNVSSAAVTLSHSIPCCLLCWFLNWTTHRYDDGGMLKLTYSTAFTVSILSWAFMQFKEGYRASGNLDFGANTIRCVCGAQDFLSLAVVLLCVLTGCKVTTNCRPPARQHYFTEQTTEQSAGCCPSSHCPLS